MAIYIIMFLCVALFFYIDDIQKKAKKEYDELFSKALREVECEYLKAKDKADRRTEYERKRIKEVQQEISEEMKNPSVCCEIYDRLHQLCLEEEYLQFKLDMQYDYVDKLHPWNSYRLECIVRTGKDLKTNLTI